MTTKTIWVINTDDPTISGASIYTQEAFSEKFGDKTWAVSTAYDGNKDDERERLIDCMDWSKFMAYFDSLNGQVGWLHLMTEAGEDSVFSVFDKPLEMWVCPMDIIDK